MFEDLHTYAPFPTGNLRHALIFATTGLNKLITSHWTSVSDQQKEEMRTLMHWSYSTKLNRGSPLKGNGGKSEKK